MANGFNKEEIVMFDEMLAGFDDALVVSKLATVYQTDQTTMERTNDVIWRPQPYIMTSFDGLDQSANFGDVVQLAVPASINTFKSSNWTLTANELRDALQEGRIRDGAKQRLSSDINISANLVASNLGSIVSKRTTPATGFDDVSQLDSLFNEQGVPMDDRFVAYNSRQYNQMAGDLAKRQTMAGRPETAYGRALVGKDIAGFDVFKMDYSNRLTAAAGVTVTMNGANQRYVPVATVASPNGGRVNVDNRFQTITIGVVSGTVKIGDAFTIAGVNSVHHITKQDTGQLKTFRITGILTGAGGAGTVQITPPIIAADSTPTAGEVQYKNVTATPANGAGLTFLNTVTAAVNPFWRKDALQILPGRIAYPTDAGMMVMRGTTDQGFELVMVKQADIKTGKVFYRVDTKYGVNMMNTEMAGVQLFDQV
ncbi:P22 phage major capsid protein family protein [Pseudomonas sp.]|uniref:P22 phage major capsid protein family protein n=1 Tax=Pseudomonas sp. TaxID=306 RepID=UPI003FD7F825